MDKQNRQASNKFQDLSDTELQIIFMLRSLKVLDKMEIKYSKAGELMWQRIVTERGAFHFDVDSEP